MSKFIKIFFRVEDDIDYNCLDKCPFGETPMCGSYACQKCKHCIGKGEINMWDLSKTRGLTFGKNYIICDRVYDKPNLETRLMRIIHLIKLKINKHY